MRQFRVGGSDGRAASLFSGSVSVLVCDAASGIEADEGIGAADLFNACRLLVGPFPKSAHEKAFVAITRLQATAITAMIRISLGLFDLPTAVA